MKLNPSNEDHRAILERFLSDQPEHRQFIDPARQSLLRVAPDEYLPISDVLDTLQILAIDHAHDLAAHEAAVKAHKANALSDQDHMNLDRDITDLQISRQDQPNGIRSQMTTWQSSPSSRASVRQVESGHLTLLS